MARVLSVRSIRELLYALGVALCAAALLLFPVQSVAAAKSGLQLCGNVIIPSLFPFFVLSSFCMEIGLVQYLGRVLEPLMRPLFRVSGACASAFVLGIIGGYPVGAKTAIALYEKRMISRDEAERLLAFCNNCGPAFIFGVVGAGVFSSSAVGLLLYLIHILSSVLVGLLFRFRGSRTVSAGCAAPTEEAPAFSAAFTASVRSAMQSTLSICAFVLFFTVIIRLLVLSGVLRGAAALLGTLLAPFGGTDAAAEKLLIGAIEMSSGVASLSGSAGAMSTQLSLAALILGWAGLCVHCQVLSFLGSSDLSVRTYLAGKLAHGVISALLANVLIRVLPIQLPVSAVYAQQINVLTGVGFSRALAAASAAAAVTWLAFLLVALAACRKSAGNSGRKHV